MEKKSSLLTRHGERDKPKSWSHRNCHLTSLPVHTCVKWQTKIVPFKDPFSPYTSRQSLRTDWDTRQWGIQAYPLRLALLTPEELPCSFSVIIANKHVRNNKRSLGFSFLHANWLTRSRQTVRFSCARGRLDIRKRSQVMNLGDNKASKI